MGATDWQLQNRRFDLPQSSQPFKGTWLVLDLWGGFSGLSLACLTSGCTFTLCPEARECAAQVMPKIVHIEQVEQLKVGALRPFVRRQAPRGILIGGVHARVTVF